MSKLQTPQKQNLQPENQSVAFKLSFSAYFYIILEMESKMKFQEFVTRIKLLEMEWKIIGNVIMNKNM